MEMTKSEYDGTLKLNTYDEITVNEYKDKRYISSFHTYQGCQNMQQQDEFYHTRVGTPYDRGPEEKLSREN